MWICSEPCNHLLDIFCHHPWVLEWWMLTNWNGYCKSLVHQGVCLSHSLPSHSVSCWWGMVSLRQVLSFLCQFAFMLDVLCQYLFHPACTNCYLNVSNNSFSDFLTFPGRICKGGVKVSGWTFSSTIFCVVRLLIDVCGIWSMDGSI